MTNTTTSRARSAASRPKASPSDEIAEIANRAEQAAEIVPADDRQVIDRAAGAALAPAPADAVTSPSRHVTGQGQLLTNDGTPIVHVMADLQVDSQTWAGQLTLTAKRVKARNAARFWLRLDDGGGGHLTVKYRDGSVYLVEGVGPFEAAVDPSLTAASAGLGVASEAASEAEA